MREIIQYVLDKFRVTSLTTSMPPTPTNPPTPSSATVNMAVGEERNDPQAMQFGGPLPNTFDVTELTRKRQGVEGVKSLPKKPSL